MKEVEKKGGIGFFTGAAKGLLGVVTKPVIGALDVGSKTLEGFKNTFDMFEDLPNNKRERKIKVINEKYKNKISSLIDYSCLEYSHFLISKNGLFISKLDQKGQLNIYKGGNFDNLQ